MYLYELSPTERNILKYACLPNKIIAKKLFISIHTVKSHFHTIYTKLNTKSRQETVIKLLKNELIKLEDFILD